MDNMIDLVLPNGKIIKQKPLNIRQFSNNDYDANLPDKQRGIDWWNKEPLTAYNMMSASPNQSHVNAEKW